MISGFPRPFEKGGNKMVQREQDTHMPCTGESHERQEGGEHQSRKCQRSSSSPPIMDLDANQVPTPKLSGMCYVPNLTTAYDDAQLPPSTNEAGREVTMQGRDYPAGEPSKDMIRTRRMFAGGRRTRGLALWTCIVLVGAGQMNQRAAGETSTPCIEHSECRPSEFCGVTTNADSFEGWLYAASYCFPCSECSCNGQSASGVCPADRCPGTPTDMLRRLEGTFFSVASVASYDGDICVTSFTVRASFFRMVSFRMERSLYDSALPALPSYHYFDNIESTMNHSVLCDFPDAPGPREGRIEKIPTTQPDMVARLRLIYYYGLPKGTTRIVELFDNCPEGFSARFLPVQSLDMDDDTSLGLETPFYDYQRGVVTWQKGVYVRKPSGYPKLKEGIESYEGWPKLYLDHVKTDQGTLTRPAISGSYSGYFQYGTTRRSVDDVGGWESLLCNITFSFDGAFGNFFSWDQYTWGCRVSIPPLPDELGQVTATAGASDSRGQAPPLLNLEAHDTPQLSFTRFLPTRQVPGQDQNDTRGGMDASSVLPDEEERKRSSRNLLAQTRCPAGSHEIYETSFKGRTEMIENGEKDAPILEQWACISKPGYCCDQCPVGKYQNLDSTLKCLSCPSGLTNNKNGSTRLDECCHPLNGIGLYNERVRTDYTEFGMNMSMFKIFAAYHVCNPRCPVETPKTLCPVPLERPQLSSGLCDVQEQYISMIPNVTRDVLDIQRDFGTPGSFCENVHLSIQPTIGQAPFSSLIKLDFNCSNCFMDLGPQGSLNISLYIVSDQTVMLPELKVERTTPPDVSRPRREEAFSSRTWKEGPQSVVPDYSLDKNFPVFQFNSSHGGCSNVSCPEMPKAYMTTQWPIEFYLKTFNTEHERQQARFACQYEDPAAGMIPPIPWLGNVRPRCEDEYHSRRRISEHLLFNDYTPHIEASPVVAQASLLNGSIPARQDPLKIGIRVQARVSAGHAGFVIGYKIFDSAEVCRAGSFSSNGVAPCSLCSKGKFAPNDGQVGSCFECPKGTYAQEEGMLQCSLCPLGQSTPERGANSSSICRYFCNAGWYSRSGIEPCHVCPRNTTQSRIGATYCDACAQGEITTGKLGTGFTNVFPFICLDATSLIFEIEETRLSGQTLAIRVTWKIPATHLHVKDIVAVFKGDPYDSIRQLQWAYASAASVGSSTECAGWVDDTGCRRPGDVVKPFASVTFELDSAGPGLYSAVFFSHSQSQRILETKYVCKSESELIGDANLRNFFCPPDLSGWEAATGLYVCDRGQFSRNGQAPCFDCPPGSVSEKFASTECMPCPQGFYANPACVDGKPCRGEHFGLKPNSTCLPCPLTSDGPTSTLQTNSLFEDCQTCEILFKLTEKAIPFCGREVIALNGTKSPITTPVPGFCGDGRLGYLEDCDDGNAIARDGCSSTCTIERFFKCSRPDSDTPDRCYRACGDGQWDSPDEDCDDGNLENEDGCSESCRIERGFRCLGARKELSRCETLPVCGMNRREWEKGEECDDGNGKSGDGCSSTCKLEPNYVCKNSSIFFDTCCATLELCGNGIQDLCEMCDDGNRETNDGCNDNCIFEDVFPCRDGCSGPLCKLEDHCDEILIGNKPQEFGLDILRWLQIEAAISDQSFVKPLEFSVPETPLSSYSKGLLVEMRQGPRKFSTFNMFTAFTSGSPIGNELYFAGVIGADNPVSQLAPTYCSTTKLMLWPSGTLSEPTGMLQNDATCNFLLDGAIDIIPLRSADEYRGVEITVHEVGFESDEEFLSIEQRKIGFPAIERIFRRGSALPVTLQMATTVTVGFAGKSGLSNHTVTWAPISDTLRFRVSYKSLSIDAVGQSCAASCSFSPECIRERDCFFNATLLTIESDHIVNGIQTRSSQESGSAHQEEPATKQTWISSEREAGAESRRQSASHVERLTMTINGISGLQQVGPSVFAQNTRQIVTEVERRPDFWRGAEGSWQGKCFIQPACVADAGQVECVRADSYFSDANLCQVQIEINDRIVREYRWNCRGQTSVEGSAHGVVVSIEPDIVKEISMTGVTVLAYRRIQVLWTRSSFDDRPTGVLLSAFLTFGESLEYEPRSSFGMQLYFGTVGSTPPTRVDPNQGKFSALEGGCRRMDLAFVDGFLTVEQLSTTYLQKSDLAGDLQNLNQYRQCNNTFQQLQVLSASRPECKNVVDTFLFRDAESSLTTVADEVCNSNCFFMVQTALEASMMKCSSVWKEFQFTGKYTDLIYKKLYIAATAHLWSRVSCFKNANEQQCTRTMLDFSELFGACSLFDSGAQKQPRLSAALMMDQPSTRSPVCPAACAEALLEYQVQDGCCSATVSEASAVWAELLSTERDDPKSPFSLDIGETANPWTPLGMGATTRYGVGHDCETSKAIYPQCFMKSSDYCDTPSWIAQCCTFPCYNNGTRGETGECFCSCPYDRVGRNCLRRSTHVRVMFVIPGEDKNSYHAGKRAYTQQALQLLTGALPEDIEWDSVADNAGNVRRRLQQSRETSSVRVVMRILAPVARDALRLSNMVLNGILDQRFADQISNVSKNMWSMEVEMAEYPPIVFDAYGREVCDDIDTTCYLKVRESALQDNVTLVIEEDDGFQGTLTSILGAVAGFLLLALVFFFFCYKEGSVFGNWWQTKTKVNLDGILPRTKDRDNRFYDYRVKQEELVRRTEKMTSTVMFEKARDKPLNYSTRGKKSGEGFVVSDDLWSSLAPSGLSNNLSNTQGIAVSSHLVFDDAMSTSLVPSGAAPTRAGTESAHAKLLIQGKGNQIIESPHVSRNSTRRAAKMVQVRQDKPNPVFFSHFLLNSKQGAAKTPSKLEVADEEDSGEVKESGLTNKGNLLDENPRPEPQPPIIVLPSSRDPLHKVLKNNFEEENSYKYTPETVCFGLKEAEYWKIQILQRLKFVKKIGQGGSMYATSLTQPSRLSDPDAGYFIHDKSEDQLDTMSKDSGRHGGRHGGRQRAGPASIAHGAALAPKSVSSTVSISETPHGPHMMMPLSLTKSPSQARPLLRPQANLHSSASAIGSRARIPLLSFGVHNDDSASVLGEATPRNEMPGTGNGINRTAAHLKDEDS